MTIQDLGSALRRSWLLSLGVFLGIFAIGVAAAFLPAERYASTATVLLQPKTTQDFDFGAQQAVQFLVPPVVARVAGADFQNQVRAGLIADGDALVELTATDEPGTGVIEIEAVATDPATAEEAAGDAADAIRNDPVSDLIEVRVLNDPTVATSISSSRRAVILLGTFVLGLIAAIFTAVAASLLRPRTSNSRQISERFGLQVIGEVPFRRNIGYPSNVPTNGTGPHAIDDAFQKLAVNIEILTKPNATIAVTSWGQGEGKTMVSARLAWAIASLGHEIVAVDCDLRKPSLHLGLGVDPVGGIADIAGGADPLGLRQQTVLDNFAVISAGEPPPGGGNPVQLVAEALPRVTEAFGDRIVLIDTPPLFTAETSVITTAADYVLLLVDARRTQPLEMRDAIRDLEMSHANILGAVLNRTRQEKRSRRAGYYDRSHEARRIRSS